MAFDFSDNVQKIFSALTSATDLRSNVASTLLSSGINLMQNNKFTQAASAFRQAAAMQPDLAEAYTYQGDAYARLGKKSEAIKAYKIALSVDPTQDSVYTNLAGVYIDNGQKSEAAQVLKDGIKQNKLNTLAYYTLGHLQIQNKEFVSAEANFREVVKLEPKDGNGYYGLGLALNGQQEYKEAVEALRKATELKKDFSPALLELGRAYAGMGDTENANKQVALLKKIKTYDAQLSARTLAEEIKRPKILSYNSDNSSLQLGFSTLPLSTFITADNIQLMTPGGSRDMTIQFSFDSDMDIASVMNPLNWRISKASGGTDGYYNNGLYSARDASVPYIPKSVTYDPTTRQATLTLTLRQREDTNGGTFDPTTEGAIIDPRHLIFKFMGKDVNGKSMDQTADQYEGWKGGVF